VQEAISLETIKQTPSEIHVEYMVTAQANCKGELTKAVGALQTQSTVCPIGGDPAGRDTPVQCQLCYRKVIPHTNVETGNKYQKTSDVSTAIKPDILSDSFGNFGRIQLS
jgi:hypothetical protein